VLPKCDVLRLLDLREGLPVIYRAAVTSLRRARRVSDTSARGLKREANRRVRRGLRAALRLEAAELDHTRALRRSGTGWDLV
jgi:hypothetical protein